MDEPWRPLPLEGRSAPPSRHSSSQAKSVHLSLHKGCLSPGLICTVIGERLRVIQNQAPCKMKITLKRSGSSLKVKLPVNAEPDNF